MDVAARGEEPRLVLFDRAAEREIGLQGVRHGADAARCIVRIPAAGRRQQGGGSVKGVAAGGCRHVDHHAHGAGRRGVGGAGLHLDVAQRFGAHGDVVRRPVLLKAADIRAIEQGRVILVFAAAHEVDLAAVGVGGRAQDAGRQLQRVRPFAAAGQGKSADHLAADVDGLFGADGFEQRRVAGRDFHGLVEVADCEIDIQGDVETGAHTHAFSLELRKANLFRGHGVIVGRREIEQAIGAGGIGDCVKCAGDIGAGRHDERGGYNGAALVGDASADATSGGGLGVSDRPGEVERGNYGFSPRRIGSGRQTCTILVNCNDCAGWVTRTQRRESARIRIVNWKGAGVARGFSDDLAATTTAERTVSGQRECGGGEFRTNVHKLDRQYHD